MLMETPLTNSVDLPAQKSRDIESIFVRLRM
jgi:hypothetical protein